MRKGVKQLEGLVFAHRWFRYGEDWAFHADIGSDGLKKLKKKFTPELTGREGRLTNVWSIVQAKDVLRGLDVVAIHKLDEECPDPKADKRQSSILIGMFVPSEFKMPEDDVIRALEPLMPNRPGRDDRLKVPQIARTKDENKKKVWLMRALVGAAIALMAVVVICHGQDFDNNRTAMYQAMREITGTESQTQESRGLFKRIKNRLQPSTTDRQQIWEDFTSIYCKPENLPDGHHPDISRLRTLLPPNERKDDPWREALTILDDWAQFAGLGSRLTTGSGTNEITAHIKDIVARLQYRPWFEDQLRTDADFRMNSFTGTNIVDKEWRDHAIRLCDPPDRLIEDSARQVFTLLAKWDVQEVKEADIQDRPWFVIHAFFAFLNRERFVMPGEDEQTAFDMFISRLPATNVLASTKYTFSTSGHLETALRDLIEGIQGKILHTRLDFNSALARIDQAMNYDNWYKTDYPRLRDAAVLRLKEIRTSVNDAEFRRLTERIDLLQGGDEKSMSAEITDYVERFK